MTQPLTRFETSTNGNEEMARRLILAKVYSLILAPDWCGRSENTGTAIIRNGVRSLPQEDNQELASQWEEEDGEISEVAFKNT